MAIPNPQQQAAAGSLTSVGPVQEGRNVTAAIYVRVSSASRSRHGDATSFDQNPDVQEQPLRDLLAQRGWKLHRVYSNRTRGAKERRPV